MGLIQDTCTFEDHHIKTENFIRRLSTEDIDPAGTGQRVSHVLLFVQENGTNRTSHKRACAVTSKLMEMGSDLQLPGVVGVCVGVNTTKY